MRLLVLLAFVSAVASAAKRAPEDSARFTANKLRVYCKACHAVGELKFIHSADNEDLWDDILHERAPISGEVWAKRIVDLLDWPADEAPPGEQTTWMPRGKKRELLAQDYVDGVPTRRVMLDTIRHALKSPACDP